MYKFIRNNSFLRNNIFNNNHHNNSNNNPSKTFSLFCQPYLDNYNQCYQNIVVINRFPAGPLAKYVRFINFPLLSEFKTPNNGCVDYLKCGYVLTSINSNNCNCNYQGNYNLMNIDEIPDLICYLNDNNYKIENNITQTINSSGITFNNYNGNKLILFASYLG